MHQSSLVSALKQLMGDSPDIIYRTIAVGPVPGIVVYIEGMAEPRHLIEAIFDSDAELRKTACSDRAELLKLLSERVIQEGKLDQTENVEEASLYLMSGSSLLILDGSDTALCVGTETLKQREVQEASSESVVRGPREGFTESLRNNTALIRRRIQNPLLRIREFRVGRATHTQLAVMYMEGKASPDVLRELYDRLDHLQLETVLESNYIEEMIQDKRYSPFPTVFNSERPDAIASALLEGRVAILLEGTPFVLVVPALFVQFFQSSEDYYQRGDFSSVIRLLRYICFTLALLTPALYIAITTFHQEMIPSNLLLSLIGQREGVPFPAFVEAVVMEVTFEILREAGIRLPKSIGQSVSIVGTLVIGQAAVEAGFVSAAMVIVVAVTAIANFALPAFNVGISIRLLRFGLMIMGASFGLYGIIIAMIMLGLHLCSLHSVGVPYMSTYAPFKPTNQKDALVRLPRQTMLKYFAKWHERRPGNGRRGGARR